MKKGFTLVEIMIAVMLFFIITTVTLNIIKNSKQIFILNQNKQEFILKSSIVFIEQKDVKNLYEQLIDFNIHNDKIIHILKKEHISFKKNINSINNLDLSKNDSPISVSTTQVYDKNYSNYAYKVELK